MQQIKDKIKMWSESVRMRFRKGLELLKTFLNKLRRHKRIVLLVIIILFLIFVIYSTLTAKPGDYLFFPKAVIEETRVNSAGDSTSKTNIYIALISDRSSSFERTSKTNNCIDLLLIENELFGLFKKSYTEIKKISDTNTQSILAGEIANTLAKYDFNSDCKAKKELTQVSSLFKLISLQLQSAENLEKYVQENLNTQVNQYNENSKRVKETNFTDQSQVSNLSGLLFTILNNNQYISNEMKKGTTFESVRKLVVNEANLKTLEEIFNNNPTDSDPIQLITRSICTIVDSDKCLKELLESKFNSIANQLSVEVKAKLNEELLTEYLNLILIKQDAKETNNNDKK